MENSIDKWITIREEYQKLNKKLDENINFLYFLPINENKHTELLARILTYKIGKSQIFLNSFLSYTFPDLKTNDEWEIYTQNNYVDCLIKNKNNAIIIENKVCGAGDQNEQIKTYVKNLEKEYAIDNIYVIYLTLFGGSPNESSLPKEVKEKLQKRYTEVTYNNEILPWLENDVLPNCPYREQTLISSIILYINYLKKMLGINVRQQTIAEKLSSILEKEYNLKDYPEIKKLLLDKKNAEDYEIQEILNIVLRQIEAENIYCNDSNVAYHLKWLLKNNPTQEYKLTWVKKDYSPFNSIGYFIYCGTKHIQLATTIAEKYIRIHMRCDIEGIKHGAYVLVENEEIIKQIWDIDSLLQNGFKLGDNNKVLTFPFNDFTTKKTLVDISIYIAKMIKMLNNAQKELKK